MGSSNHNYSPVVLQALCLCTFFVHVQDHVYRLQLRRLQFSFFRTQKNTELPTKIEPKYLFNKLLALLSLLSLLLATC